MGVSIIAACYIFHSGLSFSRSSLLSFVWIYRLVLLVHNRPRKAQHSIAPLSVDINF